MGSDISIYSEGPERYLKCLNHFQACKQLFCFKMVSNQVLEHRIQEEPTSLKQRGGVNIKHIPFLVQISLLEAKSMRNTKTENLMLIINYQKINSFKKKISLSQGYQFGFQIHCLSNWHKVQTRGSRGNKMV